MMTDQEVPVPLCCPRCGGLMYRPTGSPFYWHATSDHPRCNITNVAEIPGSKAHPEDPHSKLPAQPTVKPDL